MDILNRTFVGVRVPADQLAMIQEKVQLIKRKPGVENVRWNAPSELLLNLASLGELELGTLQALKPVLHRAAAISPPMNLEIKGFGGLPNLIQPRYLYAGIEGEDAQWPPSLVQRINQATQPLTPHREIKEFKAHILLGRLKTENEQYRVGLGRALKLAEQPVIGPWRIDHIELLISSASESGIGYTVVEMIPLGG